jgi:hypothetical protein
VSATINLLLVSVADIQMSVVLYRAMTTVSATRLLLHVRRVAEQANIRNGLTITKRGRGKAIPNSPPIRTDDQSPLQEPESKGTPLHPSIAVEIAKL